MLLAVDIGNTNITLGVFNGDELSFVTRFATQRVRTRDEYAFELLNMFSLNSIKSKECDGAIISSVVPEITGAIGSAVNIVTGCKPKFVVPGTKTGLQIKTNNPNQLGADMVVGSVAAIAKYPLPCLVIDLGTATKLFAVDGTGTFLGCSIHAGVGISLRTLASNASLLPAISIEAPKKTVCTETIECMQSGAVFGTACMLDGMIDRFEKELGFKFASIVATGGYSIPIVAECSHEIISDFNMLLYGLKVIYQKNS